MSDRQIRDTWQADGALDARERAREIAKKILREKAAPWIDAETDRAIRQRFDLQF